METTTEAENKRVIFPSRMVVISPANVALVGFAARSIPEDDGYPLKIAPLHDRHRSRKLHRSKSRVLHAELYRCSNALNVIVC